MQTCRKQLVGILRLFCYPLIILCQDRSVFDLLVIKLKNVGRYFSPMYLWSSKTSLVSGTRAFSSLLKITKLVKGLQPSGSIMQYAWPPKILTSTSLRRPTMFGLWLNNIELNEENSKIGQSVTSTVMKQTARAASQNGMEKKSVLNC